MNEQTVREVVRALNELGIPYMAVGSVSSNVHGIARLTNDADFVRPHGALSGLTPAEYFTRQPTPESPVPSQSC